MTGRAFTPSAAVVTCGTAAAAADGPRADDGDIQLWLGLQVFGSAAYVAGLGVGLTDVIERNSAFSSRD